jgi:hypothetical protein
MRGRIPAWLFFFGYFKMTLAEAQADLLIYKAARDAILTTGQAYQSKLGSVTRADLSAIEAQIGNLQVIISSKQGLTTATPVFKGYR